MPNATLIYYIFTIIYNDLLPFIRELFDSFCVEFHVKKFSTNSRTWSSLEKFVPIKEFCSDLKDDNQKTQGQVSMVGEVEQTSQAQKKFPVLLLLYEVLRCHGEQHFSD